MEVHMAHQDWSMKGPWLKNCNCAYGCPCDFNARPTHGHCEGMVGMRIESGHFGDVDLSGLHWAAVYHWPGALHEGNGTMLPVIDERADEQQRAALLTILSGLEQNDGTFLHIVSMIVTEVLEPQFVPMEFEFDLEKRTARFVAPGIFETVSEPILNPVTGEEYRVQVRIPEPFEYGLAEIASATVNKGTGAIKYDWPTSHSSMSYVEHTPAGVVQH
jgi:hypothetical protein